MTDLEVFRLSALACGKRVTPAWDGPTSRRNEFCLIERYDGDLNGGEWNPFTNAEQRDECIEALRKRSTGILIGPGNHHKVNVQGETLSHFGNWQEMPARALAELEARNAR